MENHSGHSECSEEHEHDNFMEDDFFYRVQNGLLESKNDGNPEFSNPWKGPLGFRAHNVGVVLQ